ncbi:hypothetical protein [Pedobacter agri]|uniref:hypothetical protein n=1 Tax=Pedobacter agri TaxID=454586 RepID=UPI00278338B7|nr:hypothetical protein [Pedobacter agri]MDQ1139428.1 phosphopantetheinyl transferase (holo-ACP synthase) [Pedobacter agri]
MTLKDRIALRLKALFAGVALSKKSVEAVAEKLAKGLTDESTDEDIDGKLNERNELFSFEDQKKHDDYLAGKAAKEASDKAAADKAAAEKAAAEGKVDIPEDAPAWLKPLLEAQAATTKALTDQIAAINGEKVANTRRDQYAKTLEGTSEAFKAEALADFDLLNFKDDDHYSEWLGKKTESVKVFIQEDANGGMGNDRPVGGQGGNTKKVVAATDTELDAVMENL